MSEAEKVEVNYTNASFVAAQTAKQKDKLVSEPTEPATANEKPNSISSSLPAEIIVPCTTTVTSSSALESAVCLERAEHQVQKMMTVAETNSDTEPIPIPTRIPLAPAATTTSFTTCVKECSKLEQKQSASRVLFADDDTCTQPEARSRSPADSSLAHEEAAASSASAAAAACDELPLMPLSGDGSSSPAPVDSPASVDSPVSVDSPTTTMKTRRRASQKRKLPASPIAKAAVSRDDASEKRARADAASDADEASTRPKSPYSERCSSPSMSLSRQKSSLELPSTSSSEQIKSPGKFRAPRGLQMDPAEVKQAVLDVHRLAGQSGNRTTSRTKRITCRTRTPFSPTPVSKRSDSSASAALPRPEITTSLLTDIDELRHQKSILNMSQQVQQILVFWMT